MDFIRPLFPISTLKPFEALIQVSSSSNILSIILFEFDLPELWSSGYYNWLTFR